MNLAAVDEGFGDSEPVVVKAYQCADCYILTPDSEFPHRCVNPENNDEWIDETVCLGVFARWLMRNQYNPHFQIVIIRSNTD